MSNTLEIALQQQEYLNRFLRYQKTAIATTLYESRKVMLDETELPDIELTAHADFLPLALQGGTAKDVSTGKRYLHVQTVAENIDMHKHKDDGRPTDIESLVTLTVCMLGLKMRSDALALEFDVDEIGEIFENTELMTLLSGL